LKSFSKAAAPNNKKRSPMKQNISDLSYVIIFFYKFLTDWRKIGVSRWSDLLKTTQDQGFITLLSSSSGFGQKPGIIGNYQAFTGISQ